MFFTEALIQLASNTKTTLSAQGWPATVAIIGSASAIGGVAAYGIYKHYEYKEKTNQLVDSVDIFRIDGTDR